MTLEEVAARAGVSRATASRVLRGAANVSDQARDAVLAAAEAIGYTPNQAARSLVTGRSNSIGFLVHESEERMFQDPFFLGMLRSAQETVAEAGQQLVFTVISRPADRDRFVQYAASGHVDGVLLLSLHGSDDLPLRLEDVGVPTVLSGRPLAHGTGLCYVDADNVAGGRLATEHLVSTGRQHIATVTGALDMCAGQDRLRGYRDALEQAGREFEDDLVERGGFTAVEGYAATERLLARRPDVDGIFGGSDMAAFGVIRALQAAGRRVPEDVAVVGFDDIADAANHRPSLTTVRQPVADLAATMTRLLLERIESGVHEQHRVLPVELIVRDSAPVMES